MVKNEAISVIQVFMRVGRFCYFLYYVVNFLAKIRQILNGIFIFALFAKNGTHSPPR